MYRAFDEETADAAAQIDSALLAGPVTSSLGFGRTAGLRAALAGALVGVALLALGAISI